MLHAQDTLQRERSLFQMCTIAACHGRLHVDPEKLTLQLDVFGLPLMTRIS
jgi:hypothetical protein